MSQLACPVCHESLKRINKSYECMNHHHFDIARQGYINLLLNPDKAHNNPGDSRESLEARRLFLNKGYYKCILDEILPYIKGPSVLDLGCGEGYYTYGMKQYIDDVYGLDISKLGIRMATRYDKSIYWIVGNSKNIPLLDHSMDTICALFTVVNNHELDRVLKEDGRIIHVTANNTHLIELKELIYDEIKIKSDKYITLPFKVVKKYPFKKTITIDNHDDFMNLLKMTPHYYHIKKEKRSSLEDISHITLTIDITITIYEH